MNSLKFVIWFVILLPVINLLLKFCGSYSDMNTLEWLASEACFILISFCLIYFVIGRKSKCPSCKKPFSLKKTSQEIVSKENVSVLVENKTRNRNGDVTGTSEQYVPGVRITYNVYYTCKHCGKVTCRTVSESQPTL